MVKLHSADKEFILLRKFLHFLAFFSLAFFFKIFIKLPVFSPNENMLMVANDIQNITEDVQNYSMFYHVLVE